MKNKIILLSLLLLLPSTFAVWDYSTKDFADVPHVTDLSNKNVTLLDWSTLSNDELMEVIDTPEEYWDFKQNNICYRREYALGCEQTPTNPHGFCFVNDTIHTFNSTINSGFADCGDMAVLSGVMMNGSDYGNCIIKSCFADNAWQGDAHLMWIYHENNIWGMFSEDSGYRKAYSSQELLEQWYAHGNYKNYKDYTLFCFDEHPDFIEYVLNTSNDGLLEYNFTMPACDKEVDFNPNENNFNRLKADLYENMDKTFEYDNFHRDPRLFKASDMQDPCIVYEDPERAFNMYKLFRIQWNIAIIFLLLITIMFVFLAVKIIGGVTK